MFTLGVYSLELFINISLPMTDYTKWEFKTALGMCTVCGEDFDSNVHMLYVGEVETFG